MCAKCSFTRFTKSLILKKEETFRMRVANLDYRNKQWYSPETTCMDDHVLDNNELICKVLEYIKKNFIHKIITSPRLGRNVLV